MTTTLTPWFARNIELLGYHGLGGKPAFKLAMQEVNGRWYLYMGISGTAAGASSMSPIRARRSMPLSFPDRRTAGRFKSR